MIAYSYSIKCLTLSVFAVMLRINSCIDNPCIDGSEVSDIATGRRFLHFTVLLENLSNEK